MEFYSLEDEEGDNIFLTQEPKDIIPLIPNFEVEADMDIEAGDMTQKENLCQPQYSDISDEEDNPFPCSQVQYDSKGIR